jgi:diguanylate cyclase (GGDEF)-like protein
LLRDRRVAPWKEAIAQRGFRSSASLPLKDARGTFGALTIFAGEPEAFIQEEVELLQELAGDLAYGIRTLRTRIEHKAAEEKLAFLAQHDPLTQLPNRLLLRDRFEQAIAGAQRKQARVAMMFLDLDNFKEINDSLGHAVGDHLLVGVVERLRECIRASDTVSREGGDEFVVLLTDVGDFDGAARVALQILSAIERPFEIDGNPLHTTVSIGISFYPADGKDFETLRKNSDVALFHAKDSGRNTYRFFDEDMNREAISRLQTQANLRAALKNDEFRLHYQPQIRLSDDRVVGAEALIRWQRPGGDLVAPGQFIAAAEQSGLIIPMGQWVLNEACRQVVEWRAAGLPELVVSVNLSAVQFRRGNILQAVPMALKRSGLPPEVLELELTESVLLRDTEAALETLRALKRIGVKLAVDDFGTGYSSLSYIKRLAVHKLKIDGSFVRGLGQSVEDAAIVRAIIQLGHTLELEVVAEGVETDAQLTFLRENGCDQVQGYLIGRPVPPEEFVSILVGVRAPLAG